MADAQAAARLKAGAQGGTAGVSAFDQAASQVKASQASALKELRADAGGVGAPRALLGSLSAQVRAPGQVALGNLASLGAAGEYADQQEQAGTANYMNEANASLGQIRAEADRDLAQQLAMLNASRSGGGGGGGGGGGSLSDAEVRTRVMGMARAMREQMMANAQGAYDRALARAKATLAYPTANDRYVQIKEALPGLAQPGTIGDTAGRLGQNANLSPAMFDRLNARRQEIYQTQHASAVQRDQALQQMKIRAYGPGISREAQLIAIENGVDPARAYGLFGPNEEAAYLRENEKLGLYKDPTKVKQTYSTLGLDPMQAGSNLLAFDRTGNRVKGERLSPDDINKSLGLTAFDWNGDAKLVSAYTKWLQDQGRDLTDDSPELRAAYEKSPGASSHARNVVSDVVKDAKTYAQQGYGFGTWWELLQSSPDFQRFPREFTLAATMAQPLFQAAAVRGTKQVPSYLGG